MKVSPVLAVLVAAAGIGGAIYWLRPKPPALPAGFAQANGRIEVERVDIATKAPGRILHHLRNWLPERGATVLLVGFQAQGTLGRILQDGAKAVRIQGDDVVVRARISAIDSYSGHADGPELARWLDKRRPIRQAVFLVHGEDSAIEGLRSRITSGSIIADDRILAPAMDDVFDIGGMRPLQLAHGTTRRIAPEAASRPDWHNELSGLWLDINDIMDKAADERSRQTVIRRLKRALEQTGD
jgi:metallo-beta-lactamase family protein